MSETPSPHRTIGILAPNYHSYLWRVIWSSAWFQFALSFVSGLSSLWLCLLAEAVYVGLLATFFLGRVWLVRRNGGPPPITITPEQITLPASLLSTRATRGALGKLRSATIAGRGSWARLVIDTGWRCYVFPVGNFADPNAPALIQAALRACLVAGSDGETRWAAMERRHALAAEIGHVRAFGTWCATGVLGFAFGLQIWILNASDPLGLIPLGANAPILFRDGEWFRLVTANLLHATPRDAMVEAALLVMIGTALERLAGWQRTLLVLLVTATLAQAASAVAGGLRTTHLFSIGLFGGLCGMLGALAIIVWRFRTQLPGGLRPNGATWWIAMALGAGAIPVALQLDDGVAPAAGAVTGLAFGLLLCRGRTDITALRRPQVLASAAFAAMMLIWGGAVAVDIRRMSDPAARSADRATLMAGMLAGTGFSPLLQNDVAWDLAMDPGASPAMIEQASELAARAVASATRADPDGSVTAAYIDTRAVLDYRHGDTVQAMRRELALLWRGGPFAQHFSRFLDRTLRQHGLQVLGEVGPAAPSIALSNGVFRLAVSEVAPAGARVYAVLRRHDALAGLIYFEIPPDYSGSQVLPLPWARRAPNTTAPPEIWTDPGTEIRIALFDRRSCFCKSPRMSPSFTAVSADSDLLQ